MKVSAAMRTVAVASMMLGTTSSFAFPTRTTTTRTIRSAAVSLSMTDNNNNNNDNNNAGTTSRRGLLARTASILTTATAASLTFLPPQAALAFGGGLKKINGRLKGYGLPTLEKVPDGFSPLLEIYGRGANRDPLLVEFVHPSDWVVVLPNNNDNGEDGTIQAGQYAAGDTATLYVSPGEKVSDVSSQEKDFYRKMVIRAISQKGENVYQDFKVTKIDTKTVEDGKKYAIVDFKYDLLTGAGFEVARVGVASIASEGNAIQVLWTASTRQRYKKTESALRTIADSFRCYSDGIQFTDLLQPREDDF